MTDSESFTLVEALSSQSLYPDFVKANSGKRTDIDIQLVAALRRQYPELNITTVPSSNCPLLAYAGAGFAVATLDTATDSIVRWRGYVRPTHRGGVGTLGDAVFYAKYHYVWSGEDFIIYTIGTTQYVLKEPDRTKDEDTLSHCARTDALVLACVKASLGDEDQFIYVYDGYWTRSKQLWEQVQKASWDKVILDPDMKHALASVAEEFFDNKEVYQRYGVPWRRGLIYYGPPGNGKTISIKALMHELYDRKDVVPTLYVKSAPNTYHIRQVFLQARAMSPCLLIFEDIETVVYPATRSYFFNEVDGLENNDGILMVASTNYINRLDPGLAKRPSRFDMKYLFPLPSPPQRTLYAEFWRRKLAKSNDTIDFPKAICPAFADITEDFSFAYLQEVFVGALLELAREEMQQHLRGTRSVSSIVSDGLDDSVAEAERLIFEDAEEFGLKGEILNEATEAPEDDTEDGDLTRNKEKHDPLDKYALWRAIKRSAKTLHDNLDSGAAATAAPGGLGRGGPMAGQQQQQQQQQGIDTPDMPRQDIAMPVYPHPASHAGMGSSTADAVPVHPSRFWSTDGGVAALSEDVRRLGVGSDSQGRGEPSAAELADAGVAKWRLLAESAWEYR